MGKTEAEIEKVGRVGVRDVGGRANNRAKHQKGGCLSVFPLSSSSLISSYDADTEGEPIVCIFSQSTGQKSSLFICC